MKKLIVFLFLASIFFAGFEVYAYDISKDDTLYIGGESVGIKLNNGIYVVGTFGIENNGVIYKPWADAGLREGDRIISLNGVDVLTTKDLLNVLSDIRDNTTSIVYERNNKIIESVIAPAYDDDSYSLGLYIKDCILGVGTLTYYISEANIFGSLGHKITDDEFYSGQIYEARVTDIVYPTNERAGEKKATIISDSIGSIVKNTNTGVHGNGTTSFDTADMTRLGFKTRDEINLGKAEIWTCVSGTSVEKFEIEITNLQKQKNKDIKGITFKVTDPELISRAGGIIQGMSGSPIVQDNMLIGAVTHVSLKDSKLAYGIYIEWMFEDMGINVID